MECEILRCAQDDKESRLILVCKQGVFLHLLVYTSANACDYLLVVYVREYGLNHFGDFAHELLLGTTSGDGGCTETDTRSLEGLARVERYHVLVYGDVGRYESLLGYLTREVGVFLAEVNEHAMVVCTA